MAKRRNFTLEFKAEVVLEALRGETSQAELCRRHNLSENQLSKWKHQGINGQVIRSRTPRLSSLRFLLPRHGFYIHAIFYPNLHHHLPESSQRHLLQ